MRLLITGASGLLGGRLAEILGDGFEVVAARHQSSTGRASRTVALDLLDASSIERALDEARPDAVLHSAALADADRCEREPDLARRINVEASACIARACRARSLRLVALSTDLVCGGSALVYSATKLAGEEAQLSEDPRAAAMRVALVHGRGFGQRATASEGVAWAVRAGRPLRLYTDQLRTPGDP